MEQVAAEEQKAAAAETQRRAQLLAEENRKYEGLWRQNRNCLAEYRSKEESSRAKLQADALQSHSTKHEASQASSSPKVHNACSIKEIDLPPLSLGSGCNAAEIAAFAQKLSVLSPCGQVDLELD